jgi:hypothetical protein
MKNVMIILTLLTSALIYSQTNNSIVYSDYHKADYSIRNSYEKKILDLKSKYNVSKDSKVKMNINKSAIKLTSIEDQRSRVEADFDTYVLKYVSRSEFEGFKLTGVRLYTDNEMEGGVISKIDIIIDRLELNIKEESSVSMRTNIGDQIVKLKSIQYNSISRNAPFCKIYRFMKLNYSGDKIYKYIVVYLTNDMNMLTLMDINEPDEDYASYQYMKFRDLRLEQY